MDIFNQRLTFSQLFLTEDILKRVRASKPKNICLQLEVYELKFKCSTKMRDIFLYCLDIISEVKIFISRSYKIEKLYDRLLQEVEIDLLSIIKVPVTLLTLDLSEIDFNGSGTCNKILTQINNVKVEKITLNGPPLRSYMLQNYNYFLKKIRVDKVYHKIIGFYQLSSKKRYINFISSIIFSSEYIFIELSCDISFECLTVLFFLMYSKMKYNKDIKLKLYTFKNKINKNLYTSQNHIRTAAKASISILKRMVDYKEKEFLMKSILNVFNGRTTVFNGRDFKRKNDEDIINEMLLNK